MGSPRKGKPLKPFITGEIATLFGVSPILVTQWLGLDSDPIPCMGKDTTRPGHPMTFDPAATVAWRMRRHVKEKLAGRRANPEDQNPDEVINIDKVVDFHTEKTRLTKLQADQKEIDVAVQRGELVSVEEYKVALRIMAAMFRSSLEAMPAEIKRAMPHLTASDLDGIRRITAKTINALARKNIDPEIFCADTESGN